MNIYGDYGSIFLLMFPEHVNALMGELGVLLGVRGEPRRAGRAPERSVRPSGLRGMPLSGKLQEEEGS